MLYSWATTVVTIQHLEKYNATNYSVDVGLWRHNVKESYHTKPLVGIISLQ